MEKVSRTNESLDTVCFFRKVNCGNLIKGIKRQFESLDGVVIASLERVRPTRLWLLWSVDIPS
jgi:hypothetical protein